MNRLNHFLSILFMFLATTTMAQPAPEPMLTWKTLKPIPDSLGFAGSFAGVVDGALLVAGGANFPDGGAPWTGSVKVWHDGIYMLEKAGENWTLAGKLPHALGYGASITYKNTLIILGGSNEKGHHADAWMLSRKNGKLLTTSLPQLPAALANTSAVLIGHVIYLAGGIRTADAKVASSDFWTMDLAAKDKKWITHETWPGAPRMLSVCGTADGKFYLFSGVALNDGVRSYLKDAYAYAPKTGWKKLADLPKSVAAAPGPAYLADASHLFIFGGDDGILAAQAATLKDKHPGFSNEISSYNTSTNTWSVAGKVSGKPPVTTTMAIWNGAVVIPGGEVRPAIRTPEVLIASPHPKSANP